MADMTKRTGARELISAWSAPEWAHMGPARRLLRMAEECEGLAKSDDFRGRTAAAEETRECAAMFREAGERIQRERAAYWAAREAEERAAEEAAKRANAPRLREVARRLGLRYQHVDCDCSACLPPTY
jgi:hypothetical protein